MASEVFVHMCFMFTGGWNIEWREKIKRCYNESSS